MLLLILALHGCSVDESVIPQSEVVEIRALAFERAEKYILTDEEVRTAYEQKLSLLLEEVASRKRAEKKCRLAKDKGTSAIIECALIGLGPSTEEAARNDARVVGASELKGIRVVSVSRTKCIVVLDFEGGDKTISKEPPSDMNFERYETWEGGHYWKLIRWVGV